MTSPKISLSHYLGTYYQIASIPIFWQQNCSKVKAEYLPLPNNKILVINSCLRNGKLTSDEAIAESLTPDNSTLKVCFPGKPCGLYWILSVGEFYDWAVIGTPSRDALWFLSRTPVIDKDLLQRMKRIAQEKGFDLSKLILSQDWN